MGKTDVERQAPNVFRMKLLGAEVVPVTSGRGTGLLTLRRYTSTFGMGTHSKA